MKLPTDSSPSMFQL